MKDQFILDFIKEGLVSEKMVSDETPTDTLPKVNDELPQTGSDQVADTDKEPNSKADEVHEDMTLKAAVKAVESACAALENCCACEGKKYSEEMQAKLMEMKEQCKSMEAALHEMADQNNPDLPVENPPKVDEAVLHENKKATFSEVNKYVQKELDKIAGQVKKKFNTSATYVSTEKASNVGGSFMKTSAKAFLEFLLPE